MFHGKSLIVVEVQHVTKTQTIIANVNVVDVNVTTRSKVTKEQMFKDKKLKKIKIVTHWEKEEWLKQSMVETIQQIQKTQTQIKRPSTSMEGWNTPQPDTLNTTPVDAQKYQKQ